MAKFKYRASLVMCSLLFTSACATVLTTGQFPVNFKFGVSTSAFATEGAWNDNGKGPSIWDDFMFDTRAAITSEFDGRVASSSYYHGDEDIKNMKDMGIKTFKMSISWPRLMPDGQKSSANQDGVNFYNSLIDKLLANGITPFVSLYHWDLPLALEKNMNGWLNKDIVNKFADYSDFCFKTFGDRVKNWVTIDDPFSIAYKGYETGEHAPGKKDARSTYEVAHNVLLAHAEAVSIYRYDTSLYFR